MAAAGADKMMPKILVKLGVLSCSALLAAASAMSGTAKPLASVPAKKPAASAKPAVGVSKTGVANSSAHTAVHHTTTKHKKAPRIRGQAAPTSDRISEIQTALAKSGAYKGDPSGKWDDSSVDAMKRFQQQNGLEPTGKLGALSLQKLGLGSDIAGRAAPRPQTSPRSSSSPTAFND